MGKPSFEQITIPPQASQRTLLPAKRFWKLSKISISDLLTGPMTDGSVSSKEVAQRGHLCSYKHLSRRLFRRQTNIANNIGAIKIAVVPKNHPMMVSTLTQYNTKTPLFSLVDVQGVAQVSGHNHTLRNENHDQV